MYTYIYIYILASQWPLLYRRLFPASLLCRRRLYLSLSLSLSFYPHVYIYIYIYIYIHIYTICLRVSGAPPLQESLLCKSPLWATNAY